jgi:hypothetical protein
MLEPTPDRNPPKPVVVVGASRTSVAQEPKERMLRSRRRVASVAALGSGVPISRRRVMTCGDEDQEGGS